VAKRRLRPECGVAALAKLLTTLMVVAHFASDGALPFDLMLVYQQPDNVPSPMAWMVRFSWRELSWYAAIYGVFLTLHSLA
jgi:hypothetical protein